MVGALDYLLRTEDGDSGILANALLTRRVWVLGAAVAVLPLSFHRTLDALKRASALALVFVAALVAVVLSFAFGTSDPCGGEAEGCRGSLEATTDLHSTLASLPVFVFAFTCHQVGARTLFFIAGHFTDLAWRAPSRASSRTCFPWSTR